MTAHAYLEWLVLVVHVIELSATSFVHDTLEWWMGSTAHSRLGGVGHGEGDHGLLLGRPLRS